ncbi:MAG: hypothetical protein CHACPFDD_00571 [Phycisphaerae bacterium]|nr:hypothetical protein [Phycisphaerae bacterium]
MSTSFTSRTGLLVIASAWLLAGGCNLFLNDQLPATLPDFASATFSDPTRIDNAFFPLTPGRSLTFTADTPDGVERSVVETLAETRVVDGVLCRVVRDRVYLNDVLVEDTRDWYAQDDAGNVWYMGEEVDNYNYDASGVLIDITHEGSWEAGEDVAGRGSTAHPGIIMKASPAAGDQYHQEYYAGEAEDEAEVVATAVSVTLGDRSAYTCLQTRDFTALDSALNEYKYYAPGVGLVLEEDVGGGGRVELTDISGG